MISLIYTVFKFCLEPEHGAMALRFLALTTALVWVQDEWQCLVTYLTRFTCIFDSIHEKLCLVHFEICKCCSGTLEYTKPHLLYSPYHHISTIFLWSLDVLFFLDQALPHNMGSTLYECTNTFTWDSFFCLLSPMNYNLNCHMNVMYSTFMKLVFLFFIINKVHLWTIYFQMGCKKKNCAFHSLTFKD